MILFQSTLPTRGSDADAIVPCAAVPDFNPRSPRGGATFKVPRLGGMAAFQSTLPTRGSDALGAVDDQLQRIFQSTLPTRGSDTTA